MVDVCIEGEKTLCRPFPDLVVSVLMVDGVCPPAGVLAVSIVFRWSLASWWHFGGVSVTLGGAR